MKKLLLVTATIILAISSTFAQEISKDWLLDSSNINVTASESKPVIIEKNALLKLNKGAFKLKDATGDYIHQNNLLVFYYDTPFEMVKRFKVKTLTDSTLVLAQKENTYNFVVKPSKKTETNIQKI